MKTVKIIQGFTGYPTKEGGAKHFAAGDTPEVSDTFADLIIGKGHAKAVPDARTTSKKDSEE